MSCPGRTNADSGDHALQDCIESLAVRWRSQHKQGRKEFENAAAQGLRYSALDQIGSTSDSGHRRRLLRPRCGCLRFRRVRRRDQNFLNARYIRFRSDNHVVLITEQSVKYCRKVALKRQRYRTVRSSLAVTRKRNTVFVKPNSSAHTAIALVFQRRIT